MCKRPRCWLLFVTLILMALAVYFEPTHCVRGWLHGDAFFDGRPTSYWRDVVQRDLQMNPRGFLVSPVYAPRSQTWWEWAKSWIPSRRDSSSALADDEAADSVLRDLANDEDRHLAGFAEDILRDCRPIRNIDARSRAYSTWQFLIARHNTKHPGMEELFRR